VTHLKGRSRAGRHRPPPIGRRELLASSLAAACLVPLGRAFADAPADAAKPIAALYDGLLAIMKAGRGVPFATRYAQLAPLVEQVLDLPVLLRGTVGLRWASLTSDDQSALLEAFRRYTVSSYVASFNNFGGERFDVLPDRRSVGEAVVVATQIVPRSGKPARIDYVLHQAADAGAWKVTDILLDGSISQVAVQRSEFHGLLGDAGAAPLIAALDRKTATLSGSP
jgi:phospholipid transport system substrate-binding protein